MHIYNACTTGRGGVATVCDSFIFMIMIVPYVCHDSFILIMRVAQVGGVLRQCALYVGTGGMQGKMLAKGVCVLQAVAAWCTLLQSVAVCCSLLQSVAMCCSMLPSVAVCCNLLQSVASWKQGMMLERVVSVAVCCRLLQSVAVCCSLLQSAAVCCVVKCKDRC